MGGRKSGLAFSKASHGSRQPQAPTTISEAESRAVADREGVSRKQSSNSRRSKGPDELRRTPSSQAIGPSPGALRFQDQRSSEDPWSPYASSSRRPSKQIHAVEDAEHALKKLQVSETDGGDGSTNRKRCAEAQGGRKSGNGECGPNNKHPSKTQKVSYADAARSGLKINQRVFGPEKKDPEGFAPFVCFCCKKLIIELRISGGASESRVSTCQLVDQERSIRRYAARRHVTTLCARPINHEHITEDRYDALNKAAYRVALREARRLVQEENVRRMQRGQQPWDSRKEKELVWREGICFLYPYLTRFKDHLNPYDFEDNYVVNELRAMRPGDPRPGFVPGPPQRSYASVVASEPPRPAGGHLAVPRGTPSAESAPVPHRQGQHGRQTQLAHVSAPIHASSAQRPQQQGIEYRRQLDSGPHPHVGRSGASAGNTPARGANASTSNRRTWDNTSSPLPTPSLDTSTITRNSMPIPQTPREPEEVTYIDNAANLLPDHQTHNIPSQPEYVDPKDLEINPGSGYVQEEGYNPWRQ
jgi:hypothetical protein